MRPNSTDLAQRSWRDLVQLLRQYRLPRSRHDTKAAMAGRIAAHLQLGADEAPEHVAVEMALVVSGPPAALKRVAATLDPGTVRLLTAHDLAVPVEHRRRLRRALARDGLLENEADLPALRSDKAVGDEPPAALVAGWLFTRRVGALLGWPDAVLAGAAPPGLGEADGNRRAVHTLLRAWLRLYDDALDGEVGDDPVGSPPGGHGDGAALRRALEQAIAARRCVELTYRTAARHILTRRVVEPRALQRRGDAAYLHAYCRWRQGARVFRLSRVEGWRALEETFGGEPQRHHAPAVTGCVPPAGEPTEGRR